MEIKKKNLGELTKSMSGKIYQSFQKQNSI